MTEITFILSPEELLMVKSALDALWIIAIVLCCFFISWLLRSWRYWTTKIGG